MSLGGIGSGGGGGGKEAKVCLFCCEGIGEGGGNGNLNGLEGISKFLKVFGKFCEAKWEDLDLEVIGLGQEIGLGCCSECGEIAKGFCRAQEQLRKLMWDMVGSVYKFTGRVERRRKGKENGGMERWRENIVRMGKMISVKK